ncbi:MAG: DUF1624 domain-containing protein [Oscillospiraceae bacterium]|nr:DUF1624 domain-containing protein [Oscillospiraceae bacterium]
MRERQGESIQNRVWEIDALRGWMIFCVLDYHLSRCVEAFYVSGLFQNVDAVAFVRYYDPLHFWFRWNETTGWSIGILSENFIHCYLYGGVDVFFIISGISCMFSRNNLKRALVVFCAGGCIALFTKGLAIWTGDPSRFIRFGVLFCYAFCQFLYVFVFEKLKSKWLLLSVIPIFVIGYYLRYIGVQPTRLPIFYIFGVPQIGDQSSDFWPVFPMLGWFLIGVVLGRKYYKEKKTLLPFPKAEKFTRPLQWLGRYSGIIYVSHIVVYTALFCGIGYLFHLL